MTSQRRRPAGFFRQALWIAMPVAILSAVALYSLRQDRAGIAQDARDRAQVLAANLADQWRGRVASDLEEFLVDWYFRQICSGRPRLARGEWNGAGRQPS